LITNSSYLDYFLNPRLYLYAKNIFTLTYNYLPGVTTKDGEPVVVNGALWTLHFEVLAYCALACLSLIGALKNRRMFVFTLVSSYLLCIALSFYPLALQALPGRMVTFI